MQLFLGLAEELEAAHRITVDQIRQANVEVRTNPSHAIELAKEGDLPTCSALCEAIKAQKLSAEVLPQALEMFTTHITNGCPPDKVPVHNFHLADTSFSALAFTLVLQLPDMEDPPLTSIARAWPSIIEWARARIIQDTRAFERLPTKPEEKWMLLGMFLDGIQKLRKCKELQIVVNDPRILELAVHCFHGPDVLPGVQFPIFGLGIIDFYIEASVVRSEEAVTVPWRKALDDLLSVVQGRPELLLDPILGFLVRSIHDGNLAILTILGCSEILGKLVAIWSHPFAVAMEEKGLTTLSKLLGLVTNITPTTKRNDDFANAFTLCLGIFSAFSLPQGGTTWILKALQHRIFHTLCAYSSYVSRTYEERISAIKRLLTPNLSAHLIDPSVIYACEDALSMLSAEHHEQIMSLPVASAWKSFVNRFFEQYIFYCYFDVVGHHKGCFKCGVVANSGKNATLRKCGACKLVDYCSSDCQLSDWKEHKKECKTLKAKKYPPLPRFAKASFRKRLSAYDVRRHLPGLRSNAAQKHPCFPLQCMCVRLVYASFPPLLYVSLLKELEVDYEQLLKGTSDPLAKELCFDDIRLHDGSYGILEMLECNETRQVVTSAQAFHWSPPYFSSKYGTQCPDMHLRSSAVMPYVDEEGRELATAWSVVDEIAYRGKLSPQMIFDGKIGDIRRKVLEVIVREKARMQASTNGVDAVCS